MVLKVCLRVPSVTPKRHTYQNKQKVTQINSGVLVCLGNSLFILENYKNKPRRLPKIKSRVTKTNSGDTKVNNAIQGASHQNKQQGS